VRFEVLTVVLDKTQVFWDATSLVPIMSQINPLTPELNPSEQGCLLEVFIGDFKF
jgi:hypothetical protein